MADGMAATGLVLRLKKAGESAFVDQARVVDINIPSVEVEEIDVTHQGHTWRTKIANGLKNAGEASFLVNTVDEDFEDAYNDVGLGVDVEVVLPTSGNALKFSGFIRSFEPGGFTLGEKVDHTITISVSGPVTFGAPSE